MSKEDVYIKVPCELFEGFASNAERREECIQNALYYALYTLEIWGCNNIDYVFKYIKSYSQSKESCSREGSLIAGSIKCKCFFYVSVRQLYDFQDNVKSFEQCVLFLAYHALKSIQGKKRYYKASNGLLLSRMDGQDRPVYEDNGSSHREVENVILNSHELMRFRSKYKMKRLRELLYKYYHVSFYIPTAVSPTGKKYSTKGFYFSVTMSLEELITEVEFNYSAKQAAKEGGLKSETERILEKIRCEKKS